MVLLDPEARSMVNNQKVEVCYNVQSVVEDKNKLILDYKATNKIQDYDLLSIMSNRAKEILDVESLEVLADKGYHKAVEIKECIDNNINPYIPKPERKSKYYSANDFEYDPDNDCYTCPAGELLELSNKYKRNGKNYKRYNNKEACQDCQLKAKCTRAKSRYVNRWEHQDLLDKVEQQTKENWGKYKKRQWLVEHPFGTVKRQLGAYYLLTKGIDSVSAEMGLAFCAYNIKRVMNILGNKELIKRLREWASLLFHILKPNWLFSFKKVIFPA